MLVELIPKCSKGILQSGFKGQNRGYNLANLDFNQNQWKT